MAGQRPSQRYQLGGRIGGGGMAEVFEATLIGAEGFLRPVAVKRIQALFSDDATFGRMFVNEARIASLLHHPNIAAVLDFDRDEEGRYFLVMELIRGIDLRALMDTGPLPIPIAVHIAAEMLRGLDYAHELEHEGRRLGIVHRDISPHNVMVSWDGAVKLVDFGIAKAVAATGVSRAGTIKGKVAYMSPEQASATELDGRTDVFAVGVVLHELLVGDRLFRGETEPEILARLLTQPIPRPIELAPHTPADLDAVVMGMLERDREARLASARLALEALLGTSATSPRAELELAELLAGRFPGQAPRRRSGSGAAQTPHGLPPARPTAMNPIGATLPAPAGQTLSAARPASAPAHGAWTALGSMDTLSRAQLDERKTAVRAQARRGRPWRAGALVIFAAAFAVAGVLVARREIADRGTAEPTGARGQTSSAESGAPPRAEVAPVEPSAQVPPPAELPPPAEVPPPAQVSGPALEKSGAVAPRRGRDSHRSKRGYLHVKVDPWAYIAVDGVQVGQTPQKIELAPGTHRVVLRNEELDKNEPVRVKIESQKTTLLERNWK